MSPFLKWGCVKTNIFIAMTEICCEPTDESMELSWSSNNQFKCRVEI